MGSQERYSRRAFLAAAGAAGVALLGARPVPAAGDLGRAARQEPGTAAGATGPGQQPPALARGADSLVGQLMDPERAGRLRSRVTQYENDPFVVGIEEKLRCTCGCNLSVYTCRTTDFTCETSPAMHRRVVELVEQHRSAEEIIQAFVAQYGESVLMAPPKRGFNLAGYVVPGVAITAVGVLLGWVVLRKTRGAVLADRAASPAAAGSTPAAAAEDSTLPPDEAAKIRAELEKLGL